MLSMGIRGNVSAHSNPDANLYGYYGLLLRHHQDTLFQIMRLLTVNKAPVFRFHLNSQLETAESDRNSVRPGLIELRFF